MRMPTFLERPYKVWMKISHAIGKVMSAIILTILWIVAFGFYAICLKIVSLFSKKNTQTEWKDVPPQDAASLIHQF